MLALALARDGYNEQLSRFDELHQTIRERIRTFALTSRSIDSLLSLPMTRLEAFMKVNGIRPNQLTREADISPQHLRRVGSDSRLSTS